MRILITSGVCLGDGVDGEIGQDYEVPEYLGLNLIRRGKARRFDSNAAEVPQTANTPTKPLADMKAGEMLAYAAANHLGMDAMRAQEGAEKIRAAVQKALEARGAFTQGALANSATAGLGQA